MVADDTRTPESADRVVDSVQQAPALAETEATSPQRNETIRDMEASRATDNSHDPLRTVIPQSAKDLLVSKNGTDCEITPRPAGGAGAHSPQAGDATAGNTTPPRAGGTAGPGDAHAAPQTAPQAHSTEAVVNLHVATTVGNDTQRKVGAPPPEAPGGASAHSGQRDVYSAPAAAPADRSGAAAPSSDHPSGAAEAPHAAPETAPPGGDRRAVTQQAPADAPPASQPRPAVNPHTQPEELHANQPRR